MEIHKISLNGVEYAVTDKQALQIAAILSNKIDTLETTTANGILELRDENQQLKDELDSFGWAYEDEDGTIQFE